MCSEATTCCRDSGRPCDCATILGGLLRPCLLLLIAEGKGKHGYELSPALRELGLDVSADGGRLYRVLRHLEKQGLVESEWDTQATGPARRVYSVTASGKHFLTETAASLDAAVAALDNLAGRLKQLRDADPDKQQ
ncbi:MAG: helix-turn-helix transcriptional regulator [Bacillota bacterium]|nr:helix-turn-helix transcriptional regulator [Bacillota bacterium]